eukprot:112402-Prymnesium_polylepis.1
MCLGSHRATIRREKRAQSRARGEGRGASDVESASDRAWSRWIYHVYGACGQSAATRGRPGEGGLR